MLNIRTIEWKNNSVIMIDQTKLPNKLVFVKCTNYHEVANAIKKLVIRGAPAICVAGVYGMLLAAIKSNSKKTDELIKDLFIAKKTLFNTRPTAINLSWGLEKIMNIAQSCNSVNEIKSSILLAANKIADDDIKINMAMGKLGSTLINNNDVIMTHCNAGSLATVSYGTALGIIRSTKEQGKQIKVIATETRPVQQGSRLTAFELKHDGIDVDLIPDTAVGYIMVNKLVNKIIVGADRILSTGHVFNKIGTYQLALLAYHHKIPFYVAAPTSTFDLKHKSNEIIIEQRGADELIKTGNKQTAPNDVGVINPAFDITPPKLITKIITEKEILSPPYKNAIQKLFGAN